MKDSIDRIWGILWKSLAALLTGLTLVAGWNITLMARLTDTEKAVAKLQTISQERTDFYTQQITLLEQISTKLDSLENKKESEVR